DRQLRLRLVIPGLTAAFLSPKRLKGPSGRLAGGLVAFVPSSLLCPRRFCAARRAVVTLLRPRFARTPGELSQTPAEAFRWRWSLPRLRENGAPLQFRTARATTAPAQA